jgi:hypothetical protein
LIEAIWHVLLAGQRLPLVAQSSSLRSWQPAEGRAGVPQPGSSQRQRASEPQVSRVLMSAHVPLAHDACQAQRPDD